MLEVNMIYAGVYSCNWPGRILYEIRIREEDCFGAGLLAVKAQTSLKIVIVAMDAGSRAWRLDLHNNFTYVLA